MLKKLLAIVAMLCATAAMAAADVNRASEAELDAVKGIGPGTSKLIVAERKKAAFKDWEDLISRVKGIGEARAANLSDAGVTVNGTAFKPAATATGAKKDDKKAAAAKDDKKTVAAAKPAAGASAAKK